MKILSNRYLGLAMAAVTLFMVCCKKKPFHSETGMFGTKLYHNYQVNGLAHDTTLIADEKIKLTADANSSYLKWNDISFHLYKNLGDSARVFITDSLIGSTRHVLYTLTYNSYQDKVSVWNEDMDLYWVSY